MSGRQPSRRALPVTRDVDVSARPLVIGGMHRSGTSLTAGLFASAGLDLGPALLGAQLGNPLGHFEDLGFYEFHRRALWAQGLATEGFTASGRGHVSAAMEPEARALLAARMRPGVAWGWKEPRTVLFLDYWQERLPEARHLFVFRRPWEVADSLFRRGDEPFALNPASVLDVWTHYNRLIIDFVRRHPAHCLVFEISQVVADPDAVFAAVRSRLGIPVGCPAPDFRESLFTTEAGSTRATIVRTLAPEAWDTYLELRGLAGVEGSGDAPPRREATPAECTLLEWMRASRAQAQIRQFVEREMQLRAENEARVQAENAARLHGEEEARLRAEVEARLQAEQQARLQDAEQLACVRADYETRLRTENEARLQAEHEAHERAEQMARLQADNEIRLREEFEDRLRHEREAREQADARAALHAGNEARLRAELDARRTPLVALAGDLRRVSRRVQQPVERFVKRLIGRRPTEHPAPAPNLLPLPRQEDATDVKRAG